MKSGNNDNNNSNDQNPSPSGKDRQPLSRFCDISEGEFAMVNNTGQHDLTFIEATPSSSNNKVGAGGGGANSANNANNHPFSLALGNKIQTTFTQTVTNATQNVAKQATDKVDRAVEGIKKNVIFGIWFPWLVLFRELILDGLPIIILAQTIIALAVAADDLARRHLPFCHNDIFKDISNSIATAVPNVSTSVPAFKHVSEYGDDERAMATDYTFAICDERAIAGGVPPDIACLHNLTCTPEKLQDKMWVDYDEPLTDDDGGLLEIVPMVYIGIPAAYLIIVLIYWSRFFRSITTGQQHTPVLDDLYHNENFWETKVCFLPRLTIARAFKIYLTLFFIIGCSVSLWHLNDEAGRNIAKELDNQIFFSVLIAFFSIINVVSECPASFWSTSYVESGLVHSEEQYYLIRNQIKEIPLEQLGLDWMDYLLKPGPDLVYDAEKAALLALQKRQLQSLDEDDSSTEEVEGRAEA